MIKVCMITTRHLPGDPRIFEKEARSLIKLGYAVDIVAPQEKLPVETYGINFLTFKKAHKPFRKLSTLYQTYKLSKRSDANIYVAHEIDASLFVGYIYKKLHKKKNIKLVFDSHELWIAYFTSRIPKFSRSLFRGIFRLYEKSIVRQCDAIIVANSIERAYYQILFPMKEIHLAYNSPHKSDQEVVEREIKEYDLCYEGVLNFERGEKYLFELIRNLKSRYKEIKLLILGKIQDGNCSEWAEKFIEEYDLYENIIISGWQPYSSLNKFHRKSKIGIYLYQYTPNNLLAGPPNKLFNYMKAGIPVIASNLPETKNIISEDKCGISVRPNKSDEIERSVELLFSNKQLCEKYGRNGYKAYNSKYNWHIEEERLLKVFEGIISKNEEKEYSN